MFSNSASVVLYFICFTVSVGFAGMYDLLKTGTGERHSFEYNMLLYSLLSFAGLPLVLLGSFRVNTGIDQSLYSEEYYSIGAGGYAHSDKGFQALNFLLSEFGFDDSALFFVCNILLVTSFILLVKLLNISVSLSMSLFLLSFHYLNSFSLIAQYTAIAFMCLAVRSALLEHKFSSIVFTIFAVSVHSSAVIFIPVILLYFIFKIGKNKKVVLISVLVAFAIVGILIRPLIFRLLYRTRFVYYLLNDHFSDLHSGSMILISIATLLFMTFLLPEALRRKDNEFLLTLYSIQFLFVVLSIMQNQVTLLFRLLYYFWFISIIAIPKYVQLIHNNKVKILLTIMICVLYLCWMIYFPLRGNYYSILPYRSRLFGGSL